MTTNANKQEGRGLIFLPFLRLKRGYTVAGVEFLPLRDENGQTVAVLQSAVAPLERILSGYLDREGRPFNNCVVATTTAKGWNLAERELPQVEWAASLLFLASWACNEYFSRLGGPYVNATHFRVVGQRFTGEVPTYISVSARRRDGHTMDGGYRHGEFTFHLPIQCPIRDAADVDAEFLEALNRAHTAGAALTNRLQTALPFVQLANTDDDFMMGPAEAILMGSAFEQLLRADGSAYRLSKRFGNLFEQFGSVRLSEARAKRPNIAIEVSPHDSLVWRIWKRLRRWIPDGLASRTIDDFLASRVQVAHMKWWVHRKWIEELYDLRSKVVHRGHHAGRRWGWSIFEHLVMSAYVFPLAVKLLLTESRLYELTDEDRVRCLAVDRLLASAHWVEGQEWDDESDSWIAITSRIRRDLDWDRAWEAVRRQYPRMFEGNDER